MRKSRQQIGGSFRGFAVAALVVSLAAFGCSTNRTPGDGQPATEERGGCGAGRPPRLDGAALRRRRGRQREPLGGDHPLAGRRAGRAGPAPTILPC